MVDGKFGLYLKWGTINAGVPQDLLDDVDAMPVEMAMNLVKQKMNKDGTTPASKKKPAAAEKSKKKAKTATAKAIEPKKKRTPNSYMLFCSEHRPEVNERLAVDSTPVKMVDVTKELARQWKAIEPSARLKYDALALELKTEAGTDVGKAKTTTVKAIEPKKKRTPNSYMLFCSEHRPEVNERLAVDSTPVKMVDVTKELARQWKAIEPSARLKYDALALELKTEAEISSGP
uniref:HMG box domain-containing protein n=1 Tax=Octactis speculum TaxID=3111310 RepID=A0A7S2MRR5_9STRA|mmetsp:Transcript_9077/g.11589  ORF Transcript_9077/g.11589 Transcript_9077/m.11589 type:complete len:232 (+) Transcript_9077:77-772(+)